MSRRLRIRPVTVVSLHLYDVRSNDGRLIEIDDWVDRWAEDSGITVVISRETRQVPT